jgi:hypothetical protein
MTASNGNRQQSRNCEKLFKKIFNFVQKKTLKKVS